MVQGLDYILGEATRASQEMVEPSKWSSVKVGAQEIKVKARNLGQTIDNVNRLFETLREDNGSVQQRLGKLTNDFNALATEARDQGRRLNGRLAETVESEAEVYYNGAQFVQTYQNQIQDALVEYQKQISEFDEVRPILARMQKGADLYIELADVGEHFDQAVNTLENYAAQLNAIIDMFKGLEVATDAAIAQASLRDQTKGRSQFASRKDGGMSQRRGDSQGDSRYVARQVSTRPPLEARTRPAGRTPANGRLVPVRRPVQQVSPRPPYWPQRPLNYDSPTR